MRSALLILFILSGCDVRVPDKLDESKIASTLFRCSAILSGQHTSRVYNITLYTKLDAARDRDELVELFSSLEDDRGSSLGLLASSTCLFASGNADEGARKFAEWESLKERERIISQIPDLLFVEALIMNQVGRPSDALDAVTKLIDINNDNPWNWNLLGTINISLGRWEQALSAYDSSLEVDPDCMNICPKNIECYCPSRENSYLGSFLAIAAISGTQKACQKLATGLERVNGSTVLKSLYDERCVAIGTSSTF